MRILVTGASGMVGSHAVPALLAAGHQVIALARSPDRTRAALAPHAADGVTIVPGDMTDADSVGRALDGCDGLIHAAAQIGVFAGGGAERSTNVDGVRTTVGAAVERGCDPVIYTSTFTVHLPSADAVIGPDSDFAEPLSVYGRSKLDCERVVAGWQAEGAPVTTLVLGGVYGPASPHLGGSAGALLSMIEGMAVEVDGGVPLLDGRDLAGVLASLCRPGRPAGRLMLGGGFVTWRHLNEILDRVCGRELPRFEMEAEAFIELGRDLDRRRADGETIDMPLTEDAALIMTAGKPTDDAATWAAAGVEPRPTEETIADAVRWLVDEGHLDPAAAPALAPASES